MNKILYKKNENGSIVEWYQEIDSTGTMYRTVHGLQNGKKVESGWTLCEQKNVGKANETSIEQQCLLEVQANYKKKLAQGNYKTTNDEEALDEDNVFKPMLAKEYGKHYTFNAKDKLFSQPKLDGIRCIATSQGLFSRIGKPIISAPHVMEALQPLFLKDPSLVLDGELYTERLADDFNEIISLARQMKPTQEDFEKSKQFLEYWVYDVSLPTKPFEARTKVLAKYVEDLQELDENTCVKLVQTEQITSVEYMDVLYAQYMNQGFEGQMVRVSDKGYENKRSKQLLKRKEFKDDEFEIVDIVEGLGNWSGYAKSIVFKLKDGSGRTSDSGIAGNQAFCKKLLEDKENYIGTLVTVKYQNLTPEGKPRFPVATKFLGTKKREL